MIYLYMAELNFKVINLSIDVIAKSANNFYRAAS